MHKVLSQCLLLSRNNDNQGTASACFEIPGALLNMLYPGLLLYSGLLCDCWNMATVRIPIFLMRLLKIREVKSHA